MSRKLLIIAIIGAFILMPVFASAGDLEDLEAAFAKLEDPWRSLEAFDAEKAREVPLEDAVFLDAYSFIPAPQTSTAEIIESNKAYVALFDNRQESQFKVEYRVTEGVGVVTYLETVVYDQKDGNPTTDLKRCLFVFTKVDGKWRFTAGSESLLQRWR